jgi:hypothetical protein
MLFDDGQLRIFGARAVRKKDERERKPRERETTHEAPLRPFKIAGRRGFALVRARYDIAIAPSVWTLAARWDSRLTSECRDAAI